MDWKMILSQIIIALITTSLGSILTYLKAKKEFDTKLEETKINAKNEIKKIQEQSKSELEKIKTETEAKIKEKSSDMQNQFTADFLKDVMSNPETASQKINTIMGLAELANNINNTKSTND